MKQQNLEPAIRLKQVQKLSLKNLSMGETVQ